MRCLAAGRVEDLLGAQRMMWWSDRGFRARVAKKIDHETTLAKRQRHLSYLYLLKFNEDFWVS